MSLRMTTVTSFSSSPRMATQTELNEISLDSLSLAVIEDYIDSTNSDEGGTHIETESKQTCFEEDEDVIKTDDISRTLGHDRTKKERSLDVQVIGEDAQLTFQDLHLKQEIVDGLTNNGFFKPSPIQMEAIPAAKFGYDLILQSKSGTGKTCAFGVVILENLSNVQLELTRDAGTKIQALIIAPTREIACQNKDVLKCIGNFIPGLSVKVIIGGTNISQSARRSQCSHIVSGTPGRILHMIKENNMNVSDLKIVVLDEADRLMESSFLVDIVSIFKALPQEKQVIAASATYSDGLKDFVKQFMRTPIEITTDPSTSLMAVTQYAADVTKILNKPRSSSQEEIFEHKLKVVLEILCNVQFTQAIVFSRFILRAAKIYESLKGLNYDVALLTGAQCQEERIHALRQAQKGTCKILISSDLGSRGLDCEGVDLVINFELPDDPITYIHRYGRAGRFGSCGMSITLLSFSSDYQTLADYARKVKFNVRILESADQIKNLGESRTSKFRKLCTRPKIRQEESEIENRKEILDYVMSSSVEIDCPDFTMTTFAGVNSDVEFKDLLQAVSEMQECFNDEKAPNENEMPDSDLSESE